MIRRNPFKLIGAFIEEGQLKVGPWLLQTSSFALLILIALFVIVDFVLQESGFIRYGFLLIFVLLFVQKDMRNYWALKYLEHMNTRLKYMNEVTEAIRGTMDLDHLLHMILEKLTKELRFDRAFIFLVEQRYGKSILKGASGVGIHAEDIATQTFEMDENLGIIPRTALERKTYIIKDAKNDYRCQQKLIELLNLDNFVSIPLIARDKVRGVLVVDIDFREEDITDDEISLLTIFANQASIAIENAKLYEKMEQASITDGLTGLFNHRYFQEELRKEFQRSERLNQKFSLLYLDIDNFKHFNDTYGHLDGDVLLQDMAGVMRNSVRKTDVVARYGGEEFVIILPGTEKTGAINIAEKLRLEVENNKFEHNAPSSNSGVTISIGVATFPDDESEAQAIVDFADKGLYLAKKTGKNRVAVYKK